MLANIIEENFLNKIERVIEGGEAPFIGFFFYGEFRRCKFGKQAFHKNTCCVLVLKEK
jgi:hypothetical protein